jgi:hypothetical protein
MRLIWQSFDAAAHLIQPLQPLLHVPMLHCSLLHTACPHRSQQRLQRTLSFFAAAAAAAICCCCW